MKTPSHFARDALAALPPIAEQIEGQQMTVTATKAGRNWYQITNRGDASEVFLYDEVGAWGISAGEFVKELQTLNSTSIDLHINSPGGDVFDGVAIFNALKNHKANVSVTVDGIAASAASFIAMAGDKVTMARNAQLMIHEAHAVAVGSETDMSRMAGLLSRCSDTIANIYAERAGGSRAEWRDRMRAETWYTADEAVKAGLADEVAVASTRPKNLLNTWDLSVFNYAGRDKAPDPFAVLTSQVEPEPPAEPEPAEDPADEPGFLMPIDDFRDAIAEIQDIPIDLDVFRAAIDLVVNNMPAPPDPQPAPPPEDQPVFVIDLPAVRRALKEATL